jgi:arsenite methyltransferase
MCYNKKEKEVLGMIHEEVIKKFFGCGSPLPQGIEGCTILDLGCGAGRDCYLASAFAGETGRVIGVDMTDEQLEVANNYIDYHT